MLGFGLLAGVALAQSGEPGTVGGPPTNPEFHEDPKPRSEVLVIGAGRTPVGRVEVVAFDSKHGLCINVEFLGGSGHRSCGSARNPEGRPIAISGWGGSRTGRRRTTYIEGAVAPEVVSVAVRARHRSGGVRTPEPVLSRVDAAMASRLNQDKPFGHFVAAMRGCIEIHRFRVVAFDSASNRMGRDRIHPGGVSFCGRDDSPLVEDEAAGPAKPPRPPPG